MRINRLLHHRSTAVMGLIMLLLSGCQFPDLSRSANPTALVGIKVVNQPSPTPTPMLALATRQDPLTGQHSNALPSPTPDPLRFTFPTAGAEPVAIWRPPLYPTPWEPTTNDHFYFTRPIGANEINWPLARYRYGGVFFENTVHTGIDIPAPKGTPVMAAGPGIVTWAGYGLFYLRPELNDPYGIAVAIKHDFGYQGQTLYTVYGHMDDYYVVRGQRVEGGEIIGKVGETGKVTGPHLHFEVRVGDNNRSTARNPELWIAPPQGWGILAGRIMETSGELLKEQIVNIRSQDTNQYWYVITYGGEGVNSDEYYRENMVIGDLPAGKYAVWVGYEGTVFNQSVVIQPGMVTFLTFRGKAGFYPGSPPTPTPNFTPPDVTATP
jgi:murein DD-endopeptidase MepM/ murein hydrolase activator NlpD